MPQRLLLHAGICSQDPTFGEAFSQLKAEAGDALDSRHLLCLLLIIERAKGPDSLWHPYINYLPETYGKFVKDTHAMFKITIHLKSQTLHQHCPKLHVKHLQTLVCTAET